MAADWTVIGVPIDSVGQAGGTELAPAALREIGLPSALGAEDRGDLDVRIRNHERDAESGVVGLAEVVAMTGAVRAAVVSAVADGRRPLLLGGCCALVPGALGGIRDALGETGIVYLDGHVDVYDGYTSPTGEAADMPVGVALGRGAAAWLDASGAPSIEPGGVVVLGARDLEEEQDIAELLHGALSSIEVHGPGALRSAGLATAGARAAERVAREHGRFWVHLDLDLLDEEAMPATDSLMPGGLDWDEVSAMLDAVCASPGLAGLSLGCLNPEKDPGGVYTARTAELLIGALAPR